MYKVCLRASNELFKYNPNAKYEMSVTLESGHEHDDDDEHGKLLPDSMTN